MSGPGRSGTAPPLEQLGRYRLIRKLAVGGMAEIYLARVSGAAGFEKNVVVKRILPQLAESEEFFQMFLDEARIAATLQHPNVVQTYDAQHAGSEHFIAMEYLEGADLHTVRRALAEQQQGLPIQHSVYIVSSVAAGLHYAHERVGLDGQRLEIVHRDVTPQNIILTRDGSVKLVDFGIAKASNRMSNTMQGTLKGKLHYMSPEQCKTNQLDRRTDVFSLGIILFELTTGRRLYTGETEYEVMKEIIEGELPRPSDVLPGYPSDLEAITLRALARDREERYQTALALQQDLEKFARARGVVGSALALSEFLAPILDAAERVREARARRRQSTAPPPVSTQPPSSAFAATDAAATADGVGDSYAAAVSLFETEEEAVGAVAIARVEPIFDLRDAKVTRSAARPIALLLLLLVAGAGAYYYFGVVRPRDAQRAAVVHAGPPPRTVPEVGWIAIDSEPPGAAVWLKLGRTPVVSLPVDPARPHRVRIESDGYVTREVEVAAAQFVAVPGGGGLMQAELAVALEPARRASQAPAEPTSMPAPEPGSTAKTLPQGRLKITTTPPAATAWLLLAVTPGRIGPIATGARPELRVGAAGRLPSFLSVEPDGFDAAGEARVKAPLPALEPAPAGGTR